MCVHLTLHYNFSYINWHFLKTKCVLFCKHIKCDPWGGGGWAGIVCDYTEGKAYQGGGLWVLNLDVSDGIICSYTKGIKGLCVLNMICITWVLQYYSRNLGLHIYTFIPMMKDHLSYKTTLCGPMGGLKSQVSLYIKWVLQYYFVTTERKVIDVLYK